MHCQTRRKNLFSFVRRRTHSSTQLITIHKTRRTSRTMKNVFAFALLVSTIFAVASGFAAPSQAAFGVKSASRTTATRIFSEKSDTPSPLPLATDPEEDEDPQVQRMVAINLAKGEQIEIPDYVDPAMIQASSNPFQMSWWAWIITGYPFIMLADDAFHFLPKGGIPALFNFN